MKYLIIVAVVLIGGAFHWMSQDNKQDAEVLKQQQIAHQQKLEQEQKALQAQQEDKNLKAENDIKIKELQSKYMMDYLDAKAIIESPKMGVEGKKFYTDLSARWLDAFNVAKSTSRIALSQPVQDMQQIKRDLEARTTASVCESKLKQELIKSYDFAINGFLQFMQKNEIASTGFISLSADYQKNANALIDYC